MTGAFYGSLAASASVFVAILTALLVNNYVQIKADRRQLTQRINEKERQLKDLKEDRDDHQEIIDQIREEKEQEHREEAEDNIDQFINDHLSSEFHCPIEKLTVDDLYDELLDYRDCEDAGELEDSEEYEHHKDVLEDRLESIKDVVVNRTVQEFASRHEGDGRELFQEREERTQEDEERDEKVEEFLEAMKEDHEPLQLGEFIEKYKEEYDLEELDDRTEELLEDEYDEVVDKDYSSDKTMSDVFSPMNRTVASKIQSAMAVAQAGRGTESAFDSFDPGDIGVDQRERKYERERDKLVQAKSEIESLERDKEDLERQKQRLNPGDLTSTLLANAATIFLSVVIPMSAYLATEIGLTITVPQLLSYTEVNVFLSWLLGLIIVFIAIYLRLNGDGKHLFS